MDPLARSYETDAFSKKLTDWGKKVLKTKEAMEETFLSPDHIDVDRMKEEIFEIIDEGFPKEK